MVNVKKRFFLNLIFFIFWAGFNLGFFYIYHHVLNLSFSITTSLFIIFLVVNFVLLFIFFKNKFLRSLIFFIYGSYIFYILVNFAYYKVFKTFWRINIAQLSQVNRSLLDLLSDFYFLIPWYIYALTLGLLLVLIFVSTFYTRLQKEYLIISVSLIHKNINFIRNKKNKPFFPIIFVLFLLVITNILSVALLKSYRENINEQNFSRSQFLSDLGTYGYLLHNQINKTIEPIKDILPQEALAQTQEISKTDIEKIKDDLLKLSSMHSSEEKFLPPVQPIEELPHIIIYQMESVGSWALKQNPSPMPYLQSLMDKYVTVDHFFSNSCTTINAEFSTFCSFFSETYGPLSDLFSYNDYYCLPSILQERYGYETSWHHANTAEFWNREILGPRWGIENLYFMPYYKEQLSDLVLLEDVINKIKLTDKPTFNHIIGLTSHAPHNEQFREFHLENNNINIEPYKYFLSENTKTVEISEEDIRMYFGFLTAVDDAIKNLFNKLENNSLLENTIVIILGDHRYYNFVSEDELQNFYNYNEVPFVMYVPGDYRGKIQNIASQVDIAPTILHLLEGDNYSMPKYFVGQSIFSNKHPNTSISKCLGEILFIDQDVVIRGDATLDIYRLISQLDLSNKLVNYTSPLRQIVSLSDKMLIDNKLCETKKSSLASIPNKNVSNKKIDFDQITDTDKDGLSDLREKSIGTNRLNPDTDGDGYLDGEEVVNGYDPLGPGKLNDLK